jgi:membrane associated rhomboid family serine protease
MNGTSSIWEDIKFKVFESGDTLYQLIFINVAVFVVFNVLKVFLLLFQLDAGISNQIYDFLAVPADPVEVLTHPWTLITYMFMHGGIFHILFNMLILYWFGRIFQEYLGNRKLFSTFIVGGLAGAAIFILAYQIFPLLSEMEPAFGMVGASAGVLAVVAATATLLPDFTLNLLLFGPVRLKYIAMVLVLLSLLKLAGANSGGNFAHIGGAIYGYFFIRQLQQGNDIGQWFNNTWDKIRDVFSSASSSGSSSFKVHRNKTQGSKAKTKQKDVDQKEIDRILDKIAESGYDSLTDQERDTLFKASK